MRPRQPLVGPLFQKLLLLSTLVGWLITTTPGRATTPPHPISLMGSGKAVQATNADGATSSPIIGADPAGVEVTAVTKDRTGIGAGKWINGQPFSFAPRSAHWLSKARLAPAALSESLVSWNVRLQI